MIFTPARNIRICLKYISPCNMFRHSVLRVVQQLVVDKEAGKARDDLGTLLEVMQSSKAGAFGTLACKITSQFLVKHLPIPPY